MLRLDWPAICHARAAGVGSIRCPLADIGRPSFSFFNNGVFHILQPDTDRWRVGKSPRRAPNIAVSGEHPRRCLLLLAINRRCNPEWSTVCQVGVFVGNQGILYGLSAD